MNKFIFAMPLMAISLLASCGGAPEKNSFTVTWKDWDGTILETDVDVARGTVPSYEHDEPSREADKAYTYDFKGWDGDITKGIVSDTVFTAQYNSTVIPYTVTFRKNGQSDIVKDLNINNLEITAPTFSPVPYHTCQWVSESGEKVAGSEETIIFTKDDLDDWVFIYQDNITLYDVIFKDGSGTVSVEHISINNLTITAPDHDPTEHYDGVWKENNTKIDAKGEHTFTESDLKEHTFTWTITAHDYNVTFNYADGTTPSVEKKISISSLELAAPATIATPQDNEHHYVWKSDDFVIESEKSKTFDPSELKDYVFTETEIVNVYSITYELSGGTATGNPTEYKASDKVTLNDPTLSGYTFKGWYLDPNESEPLGGKGWESGAKTGDITLYADWHFDAKTLDDYTWAEISSLSEQGIASRYFDVGDTKKVQLKHQSGNITQTVRIIGFHEDYTELPIDGEKPDPSKSIGMTFDFVDLISDENGYSLATFWMNTNDTSNVNHDYINSSVRKALTGEGNGDLHWYRKEEKNFTTDTKYANKSVLDMLPEDLTKNGILKTACKYINIWNKDKTPNPGYDELTVSDKLFLLSPYEIGNVNHDNEEQLTNHYNYYRDAETYKSNRIKKQIKGHVGAIESYFAVSEGEFTGAKSSFAGNNGSTKDYYGSYPWLRSPHTEEPNKNYVWYIHADGEFVHMDGAVYRHARPIAPAFCV